MNGTAKQAVRDAMRTRFNELERRLIAGGSIGVDANIVMEIAEAEELIGEVCGHYGVLAPQVVFSRSRSQSCYQGGSDVLRLSDSTRMRVLHETAHIVADAIAFRKQEATPAHGGMFVRVYVEILCRWMPNVDRAAVLGSIKALGLEIAPASDAKPLRQEAAEQFITLAAQRRMLSNELRGIDENLTRLLLGKSGGKRHSVAA